jgi:hypothetical protein
MHTDQWTDEEIVGFRYVGYIDLFTTSMMLLLHRNEIAELPETHAGLGQALADILLTTEILEDRSN